MKHGVPFKSWVGALVVFLSRGACFASTASNGRDGKLLFSRLSEVEMPSFGWAAVASTEAILETTTCVLFFRSVFVDYYHGMFFLDMDLGRALHEGRRTAGCR